MRSGVHAATRTTKVVLCSLAALSIALFAFPVNLLTVLSGGPDVPLVSVFLIWIREQILPPVWTLVSPGGGLGGPTELFATASVALALMIGYPLIAYAVFDRIVPQGMMGRRTRVYALTSLTSVVFLAGVLLGIFFLGKFIVPSYPPQF